jgi:hypothetical protein
MRSPGLQVRRMSARERQVLVDVEHVVDEHARIGDGHEVALAEAPFDDERRAWRKRERRRRRRQEEGGVIGDHIADAHRQLRRQRLPRDRQGRVAVVAIDGRQLAAQPADVERRQRRVGSAEVVGDHRAPAGLEPAAQLAAVDGGARIDEPHHVARVERRPVERLGRRDRAARGVRLVREPPEAVPLVRIEAIVAAGGQGARRGEHHADGDEPIHISLRRMPAPRSSSRRAVARCASRLVASTTK